MVANIPDLVEDMRCWVLAEEKLAPVSLEEASSYCWEVDNYYWVVGNYYLEGDNYWIWV